MAVPQSPCAATDEGFGSVWTVTCEPGGISRIDPAKATNRYPVAPGASAVRAGLGGVWITNYQTDTVVRLDPSTGKIVATIPVAPGPRFFDVDVGAGTVWVMAQTAGALCRIDPADDRLVGCTVIDPAGVEGGDLTVGNGFVWFRAPRPWSPPVSGSAANGQQRSGVARCCCTVGV